VRYKKLQAYVLRTGVRGNSWSAWFSLSIYIFYLFFSGLKPIQVFRNKFRTITRELVPVGLEPGNGPVEFLLGAGSRLMPVMLPASVNPCAMCQSRKKTRTRRVYIF
jgi:hypothetical protein